MRKVVYLVAASLDGRIARADGSFDCFVPTGEHVDDYLRSLGAFDDVLMGRATYEVGLEFGVTDPYPSMRSHVFSRTMEASPDPRVRLVRDDPVDYVRALKDEPGRDVYLCGGARLASTLLAAGLVDEIVVKLNPLLIGDGIPLFAHVARATDLELRASKVYDNGVALLTYGVRGPSPSHPVPGA